VNARERRLLTAARKAPDHPPLRPETLETLERWADGLSNEALDALEEICRHAVVEGLLEFSGAERRVIEETAVAVSEGRCCPIGVDRFSRHNWRLHYSAKPSPRTEETVVAQPLKPETPPAPKPVKTREPAPDPQPDPPEVREADHRDPWGHGAVRIPPREQRPMIPTLPKGRKRYGW
jgi:hypothetical protein